MPPADSNTPASTPTPTPAPEQPKVGFFAKLFGKKAAPAPVVPQRESQTPPPQLDDNAAPVDAPVAAEPAMPAVPAAAPVSAPAVDAAAPAAATPAVPAAEEPKSTTPTTPVV